ncbi:hypothetical protein GYH30_050264 [Glycine max]|nr:hypothetical protein GYH30_050264 [Glycine max]
MCFSSKTSTLHSHANSNGRSGFSAKALTIIFLAPMVPKDMTPP